MKAAKKQSTWMFLCAWMGCPIGIPLFHHMTGSWWMAVKLTVLIVAPFSLTCWVAGWLADSANAAQRRARERHNRGDHG